MILKEIWQSEVDPGVTGSIDPRGAKFEIYGDAPASLARLEDMPGPEVFYAGELSVSAQHAILQLQEENSRLQTIIGNLQRRDQIRVLRAELAELEEEDYED